jgi:hypothetical protein
MIYENLGLASFMATVGTAVVRHPIAGEAHDAL